MKSPAKLLLTVTAGLLAATVTAFALVAMAGPSHRPSFPTANVTGSIEIR